MGADVFIFKRDKANGYYQDDMKCECIGEFQGWAAHSFIMGVVNPHFTAEGSAALRCADYEVTVLQDREDYNSHLRENYDFYEIDGIQFAHYAHQKYVFYHRVELPFFKALVDGKEYKQWSRDNYYPAEKHWLREQLVKFRKIIPTLDFEKNYYYIVESI